MSEIYFQAQIGECHEFLREGKKQAISIVISPLKVVNNEDALKITQGCNMWKACENKGCQFSVAAHPPIKK